MAQEKEIQSSYFLTEVKADPLGRGEVDYVNIIQPGFLLPHFTIPDAFGKEFSLKKQIGKHHIILAFLHRVDCPCTRPLLETLQQELGEIQARHGLLIAVTGVYFPKKNKIKQKMRVEVWTLFFVLLSL